MSRNLCSVRRVRIVHVVRHGRSILVCSVHLCISSRCHIIGGMHSIHSTRSVLIKINVRIASTIYSVRVCVVMGSRFVDVGPLVSVICV